jgi:hypothetical protein
MTETNTSTESNLLGKDMAPPYVPNSDERTLAILAHALSLFFWIFPALIIYLLKKNESSFVANHAREALNFQITLSLVALILAISLVGLLFIWIIWPIELILCIVAAIKASDLRLYRYPFNIRLIK